MTEQTNVSETTSQSQNVSSAPVQQVSGDQSSEKLLRQSEVNDLVGKAKHAAYEKGRQEALASSQTTQANPVQSMQTQTVNSQSQNNAVAPQLTPEQQQKIVEQVQQNLQAQQLISQFALKMSEGNKKYSDFEKVVTSLNLPNIPDVVQLANSFDNTAEIMYDLGKPGNEAKIANLRVLNQINPHKAFEAMQNLSNSIKQNEQAVANQKPIREPLSPIKSSNVGSGSGKLSVAELRKHPLYRA